MSTAPGVQPTANADDPEVEVGVLEYVQEAAAGAAALLQAVPVVRDVCATFLAFGRLVDTANRKQEELAVLRNLFDAVIKGFIRRSSDLPEEDAAQGSQNLKACVTKAMAIAKLCNKGGSIRDDLAREMCYDIASVRKHVRGFSKAYDLVLTDAAHVSMYVGTVGLDYIVLLKSLQCLVCKSSISLT